MEPQDMHLMHNPTVIWCLLSREPLERLNTVTNTSKTAKIIKGDIIQQHIDS